MRRIVLDAQYSVMTSALTMALKQGGPDFQVQNAGPKTKDIVKLCRSCRADVLLLAAVPFGIASAIYLAEYAKKGSKIVALIRVTTETQIGRAHV